MKHLNKTKLYSKINDIIDAKLDENIGMRRFLSYFSECYPEKSFLTDYLSRFSIKNEALYIQNQYETNNLGALITEIPNVLIFSAIFLPAKEGLAYQILGGRIDTRSSLNDAKIKVMSLLCPNSIGFKYVPEIWKYAQDLDRDDQDIIMDIFMYIYIYYSIKSSMSYFMRYSIIPENGCLFNMYGSDRYHYL